MGIRTPRTLTQPAFQVVEPEFAVVLLSELRRAEAEREPTRTVTNRMRRHASMSLMHTCDVVSCCFCPRRASRPDRDGLDGTPHDRYGLGLTAILLSGTCAHGVVVHHSLGDPAVRLLGPWAAIPRRRSQDASCEEGYPHDGRRRRRGLGVIGYASAKL